MRLRCLYPELSGVPTPFITDPTLRVRHGIMKTAVKKSGYGAGKCHETTEAVLFKGHERPDEFLNIIV
jgi:hypothetical protein